MQKTMNNRSAAAAYGAGAYRSEAVQAAQYADPHALVTMLFDGALERLSQARGAIEHGMTARKGERIGKALAIVDSLRASLDLERGGAIASQLQALYGYMEQRLLQANLRNDVAALDEVAALLREIRSGWEGISADATRQAAGR